MKLSLRLPLVVRILIGAGLGVGVGYVLGPNAGSLKIVSDVVLQLLRLLATPLVFFCLVYALVTTHVSGRTAGRLIWLLLSNTAAAALIGIGAADLLRPGSTYQLSAGILPASSQKLDAAQDFLDRIPKDFVTPFFKNDMIGVILIGLGIGIGLRAMKQTEHAGRIEAIAAYIKLARDLTLRLLHWLFELIPLAVLAVVAQLVGKGGLASLASMLSFVWATIAGLLVLFLFYMVRLSLSSRVKPIRFLRGSSEALVLAFSTASSAATLPVTYDCAVNKIGVAEPTAGFGVLVGGTFSHDGGALYQALAAIYVSQATGHPLSFAQQAVVLGMAIVAAVSVAGVPEGNVPMMIAVFASVHLPAECIPLLLPLDWLLDRCRTAMNVCGDLVATCILDAKTGPVPLTQASDQAG